MISARIPYATLFLLCAALLGFGFYLQAYQGQDPCPLCIFQRVCYMAVGVVALVAAVHGPRSRSWIYAYTGVIALLALTGATIAARQVWLQHLPPDQVPECGPGLDYMLNVFPLSKTLRMVFTGSGECAQVGWTFLSLSIAEWSLIWFSLFTAGVVFHAARTKT